MLAVVWGDELGFDLLGQGESLARQIVNRALDDWNNIILDFNFDGDNNPQTDNTLVVNIGIFPFLGETRGVEFTTQVDANGRPRAADIFVDVDGGGSGWFFDPTPDNDAEFLDGFLDPFRATIAGGLTSDFYRTVAHELGHAVGIAGAEGLAISKFYTQAGKDQVDGQSDLLLFNNPQGQFGRQGFEVTLTTQGGIHVYEGPADPLFPSVPIHPGDLLNPGRAVQPPPITRQLISDLNVKMLIDVYQYNARLPSTVDTFHVVMDSDGQVSVRGGSGDSDDQIVIRRAANELQVHVNETVERVPLAEVTTIVVEAGAGADQLTIDYSGDGNPIPAGGIVYRGGGEPGAAQDTLRISGGSANSVIHTLDPSRDGRLDIDGSIVTYVGPRSIRDELVAANRTLVFGSAADQITVGDDPTAGNNMGRIVHAASNRTVDFAHPTDALILQGGAGADTFRLQPLDAASRFRLIADGGDGQDTLDMQGGVLHATMADTDEVVLESGESLAGTGTVFGHLRATEGSQVRVTGSLSAADLSNDGTLVLDPASRLHVRDLDNAGGVLVASASSEVVASGTVSPGGLGSEKQFGMLTLTGPAAAIRGPVDALGAVRLTSGARLTLSGTIVSDGLVTDPGTLLDAGSIDLALSGNVALANDSFRGTGTITLVDGGTLTGNNNSLQTLVINHQDTTTVSGLLTIGSGGVTIAAGTLSLEDDVDISGPVTVASGSTLASPDTSSQNRWVFRDRIDVQSGAFFELRSPGSQSFFALGARLIIQSGAKGTIAGSEAMPLALHSLNPGQTWRFEPANPDAVRVRYVDLRDANASASPERMVAALSVNSGNNTNWFFVAATTSVSLDPQGKLLIDDVIDKPDTLNVGTDGTALVIEDSTNSIQTTVGTQVNTHRVVIPQSLITGGQVIIELDEGDDVIEVSPSGGQRISVELFIDDLGEQDRDQLIVDLSRGGTVSAINFDGGDGQEDSVQIIGDTAAQSVLEFSPGQVNFNQTPIDFSATEAAFLSNVRSATYLAPIAENRIVVSRPVGEAILVAGTVDRRPFTEFTFDDISKISNLIFEGDAGAEHLILDHTSGLDPIPGAGIIYHAGPQPEGSQDVLEILGGAFTRVEYDYDTVAEGTIDLSGRRIRFTGVEPIINSGTSSNLLFDLTALGDQARLVNAGNGMISLISLNGTFQSTTVPTPSLRITVFGRAGGDSLAVEDLSQAGFTGELRLLGEAGDDRFELAASRGIDIDAQGGAGENRLTGSARGPLVFNGGSTVALADFTIVDTRDGRAAVEIADAQTNVRLTNTVVSGANDDLFEIANGLGAPPPTLDLSQGSLTLRFESGADRVAFVDNRTSPLSRVDVHFNTMQFDVARNGQRTVRLASDNRTIVRVTPLANTHGIVTNNGDGSVTYRPDIGYVGQAAFQYELSDGSATTVDLNVVLEDRPPVNTVPPTQSIDEDVPLVFSLARGNVISTSDPDAQNDDISVQLTVTGGNLLVTPAGRIVVDNNDSSSVTLTGTTTDINASLNGLLFNPRGDFNGVAVLTVRTDDLGNNGAGGPLTDTDTVQIVVRALNDPPVHQLPGGQTTDEDTQLVFSPAGGNAITVADADAGQNDIDVTLAVRQGTLTLPTTAGLTRVTGQGTGTVNIRGVVANISAALNGLRYSPRLNFGGADTLTITSADLGNAGAGGPLTTSNTLDITVTSINDAPLNAVPGPQVTVEEGAIVFSLATANAISVTDADAGDNPIEMTVSVDHGSLRLATTAGLETVAGDGSAVLTITGSTASLNAALDRLTYRPDGDFAGADLVSVRTNDLGHVGPGDAMIDLDTVEITVSAINDPPRNTVPAPVTIAEDSSLVFSVARGNPIAIVDVDAGDRDVDVTLRVGQGVLNLAATDGLTSVLGDGTANVRIVGSVANINAAVDGLTYVPRLHFNGQDTLAVTTSDLGNSGTGGVLTDTDSFAITITAVNDGPLVTFSPVTVTVLEDAGPQTFANFARVTAGPPDEIAAGQTVTSARITANSNPGLFSAQPVINASGTLTFTPAPEAFGVATVTFTATDSGGTAGGGQNTTVLTFDIVVLSDNNPPVAIRPFPDVSVDEDAPDTLIALGPGGSNFFTDADREPLTLTAVSLDPSLVTARVVGDQLILDYQDDEYGTAIIEVAASDAETSTTTSFMVTIEAVNDAPANRLPAPQTATRGVDLVFSTSAGNPISITDVDVGIAAIQVQLSVAATQGTLRVSAAEGSNVTGDGTSQVTIIGPLPGVNAALNGLTYSPPPNFSGTVTLSMVTNDLGNTGSGGAKTDTDSLLITVEGPVVVQIAAVAPDPRAGAVNEITIRFTAPVTGFDLGDLALTRSNDTKTSLLPGPARLTTSDNITWRLNNLGSLTGASGMYELRLAAAGSGIRATGGGSLASNAVERWTNGAGDANNDRQFNQVDLILVLQAGTYLTGRPATWSQGDWNGDGVFNPLDIVVAQQTQPPHYLRGPFAASAPLSPVGTSADAPLAATCCVLHDRATVQVTDAALEHLDAPPPRIEAPTSAAFAVHSQKEITIIDGLYESGDF